MGTHWPLRQARNGGEFWFSWGVHRSAMGSVKATWQAMRLLLAIGHEPPIKSKAALALPLLQLVTRACQTFAAGYCHGAVSAAISSGLLSGHPRIRPQK